MGKHYISSGKFLTQIFLQQCLQTLIPGECERYKQNQNETNPSLKICKCHSFKDSFSDEVGDAEKPVIQTGQFMAHLRRPVSPVSLFLISRWEYVPRLVCVSQPKAANRHPSWGSG